MNANIAAAKGIEPCPMCGSAQVRWRRRRWYDVVKTQARWLVEALLHAVTGAGGPRPGRHYRYLDPLRGSRDIPRMSVAKGPEEHVIEESYARRKLAYEYAAASKTPARFWSCRACDREGHEFDDMTSVLQARESVAEAEDAVRASGGTIVYPIDRDGMELEK